MDQICDYSKCYACGACIDSCPRKAIRFHIDRIGVEIPIIDQSNCIDCGICASICPNNSEKELHKPEKCFAAWANDENDYQKSSSGGIAHIICKVFLKNGGVIYGASFFHNEIMHIRIDKESQLDMIRGSKYAKSTTVGVLNQIISDLDNGLEVLFIGTPCQVYAIKSCTNQHKERLSTIDLVCHGVPLQKYLFDYIHELGVTTFDDVKFRIKDYCLCIKEKDEVLYQKRWNQDLYYSAFMLGLINRECCYSCDFACTERCGDITLGDFRGIGVIDLKQYRKDRSFISMVFSNNDKGFELLGKIKDYCYIDERDIREAIMGNSQLYEVPVCHKDRKKFLDIYQNSGFLEAVKSTDISKYVKRMRILWKLMIPYRFIKYKLLCHR